MSVLLATAGILYTCAAMVPSAVIFCVFLYIDRLLIACTGRTQSPDSDMHVALHGDWTPAQGHIRFFMFAVNLEPCGANVCLSIVYLPFCLYCVYLCVCMFLCSMHCMFVCQTLLYVCFCVCPYQYTLIFISSLCRQVEIGTIEPHTLVQSIELTN